MARDIQRSKRGVTLLEVMLAASLLSLAVLSLLEGVGVCSRIAHENAQYLVADAYAHDLAWKRWNTGFAALQKEVKASSSSLIVENISSNAVPMLWRADAQPKSYTTLRRQTYQVGDIQIPGVLISVDVEWGAANNRRRLSATHTASAFKADLALGGS